MTTETQSETTVDIANMSVWQRLLAARRDFFALGVKKSGINQHAEFTYFELEDIVPAATEIFARYNCLFITTFPEGKAVGRLVNLDDSEKTITVEFTTRSIAEPAKFRMNEVQGLGAEITYMRRYLYFLILDVVEADKLDCQGGIEAKAPVSKKATMKPATSEQRTEIKQVLTDADGNADELQISALKAALKELRKLDPAQDDFVQKIAIQTDKFKNLKKSMCEALIIGVGEMIESYNAGKAGK